MTNKDLIIQRLRLFEEEEKNIALSDPAHGELRVLLAVEEGSRAWNIHCSSPSSSTSDFDVRFIYMRSPQHYLSIEQAKKDALRFEDASIPAVNILSSPFHSLCLLPHLLFSSIGFLL
jgi:hypothetical protein